MALLDLDKQFGDDSSVRTAPRTTATSCPSTSHSLTNDQAIVGDHPVVKTNKQAPSPQNRFPIHAALGYQSSHIVHRCASDSRYEQGSFAASIGNGDTMNRDLLGMCRGV